MPKLRQHLRALARQRTSIRPDTVATMVAAALILIGTGTGLAISFTVPGLLP